MAGYEPPPGYMTTKQAQERLGISAVTLRQRIRRGVLQVYENGRDTRVRLLKIEDVERLAEPHLISQPPASAGPPA